MLKVMIVGDEKHFLKKLQQILSESSRILICFMRNHNRSQTKSPRVSLVKETNPFRRDYGGFLKKSSVLRFLA